MQLLLPVRWLSVVAVSDGIVEPLGALGSTLWYQRRQLQARQGARSHEDMALHGVGEGFLQEKEREFWAEGTECVQELNWERGPLSFMSFVVVFIFFPKFSHSLEILKSSFLVFTLF